MEPVAEPASKRATWLLVSGALAGLLLAVTDVFERSPGALPDDVVARVDGELIGRTEFDAALLSIARRRGEGLSGAERRRVLDRIIDERLLVSRGLELGLVHDDVRLRRRLIGAMTEWVTREMRAQEPTDQALREFYRQRAAHFSRGARYRLRHMFFVRRPNARSSAERASAARAALVAGQAWDAVAARADATALRVPDALLPASKLQDYLGPALVAEAVSLPAGGISAPLPSGGGHALIALVDRRAAEEPDWDAVRDAVREEYRRRNAERRLSEYLDALRQGADIQVAGDLGS